MASNQSRPQANRGYSAPLLSRPPSSPASPTGSDISYFSPQAPSTSSVSPSLSPPAVPSLFTPQSPSYPIITATVTSRQPGGSTTTTSSVTMPEQDPLRQFAMHFPNPPTLSLAAATRHHHSQSGPQVQPVSYSAARLGGTPGYEDLPSPMDRSRRMPPSSHSPQMHVSSSIYNYILSVQLPAAIQPEMVTVCANKGDKIKVVADVWHMENESHYEWQISFPPHDIDMGAVHARFDDARNLTIDVRRIPRMYRT